MKVDDRLIVALDVPDVVRAEELVALLRPLCPRFKIGLQLFPTAGPDFVRRLVDSGLKVFLDLKLFDVPNTVKGAVRSIAGLGVEMLTVHAAGGPEMMRAATEAAAASSRPPLILAVTVLTSMTEEDLAFMGVTRDLAGQIMAFAEESKQAGCKGVIASARDASALRKKMGPDFKIVTPGIRPSGVDIDDQKRVGTPKEALQRGADFIVVGRPILNSPDPLGTVRTILAEMKLAEAELEPLVKLAGRA